jgi:hypothetical protein
VAAVDPKDKLDLRGVIADIAQIAATLGAILVVALK